MVTPGHREEIVTRPNNNHKITRQNYKAENSAHRLKIQTWRHIKLDKSERSSVTNVLHVQ